MSEVLFIIGSIILIASIVLGLFISYLYPDKAKAMIAIVFILWFIAILLFIYGSIRK